MVYDVYRVLGMVEMPKEVEEAMVACGITSGTIQRALWTICVAETFNEVAVHMDKGDTANG